MSDPLVAFLHACIDDDERMAREADPDAEPISSDGLIHMWVERTAIGIDAERMLAEVEVKREILKRHQPRTVTVADYEQYAEGVVICSTCSYPHGSSVSADEYQPYPCPTVRALLIPYVDRPGYDPAWKVGS